MFSLLWLGGKHGRVFLSGVLTASLILTVLLMLSLRDGLNVPSGSAVPMRSPLELRVEGLEQKIKDLTEMLKDLSIQRQEAERKMLVADLSTKSSSSSSPTMMLDGDASQPEAVQRANHIRHVCQGREHQLEGITAYNDSYFQINIDRKRNYMYCPIFKVGTTFLRRAFYSLSVFGELKNPYSMPIERALKSSRNNLIELFPLTESEGRAFLSQATKFLVVREPFVRLVSGYMDKLFAPNPYFWKEIGRFAVSQYRPQSTLRQRSCGHDLTFNEFLQYVIGGELDEKARQYRNPHFTPAYDQCKVCHLNYTLVGKMETFAPDLYNILNSLHIDVTEHDLQEWNHDVVKDAITDSVKSPFGWKALVRRCMTWFSGLRRVWRKLQSRAIIPLEEEFPFTEKEAEKSVTSQEFITTAYNTYLRADKARLKRQKKEILAMAYRNIDFSTMSKLIKVFEPDFSLFQYDIHPDFIFNKTFIHGVDNLLDVFDMRTL